MNQYKVVAGVAKFGPGQKLVLSAGQIKDRRHNLEVPKDWDGKVECPVTSLRAIEFKVGEIVGLDDLDRRLVDVMVPIGPAKSQSDKDAVARAQSRADEKAKSADGAKKKAAGVSGRAA